MNSQHPKTDSTDFSKIADILELPLTLRRYATEQRRREQTKKPGSYTK